MVRHRQKRKQAFCAYCRGGLIATDKGKDFFCSFMCMDIWNKALASKCGKE